MSVHVCASGGGEDGIAIRKGDQAGKLITLDRQGKNSSDELLL